MFEFLKLELSVGYGLLFCFDDAFEVFKFRVEAGEGCAFFEELPGRFGVGSLRTRW